MTIVATYQGLDMQIGGHPMNDRAFDINGVLRDQFVIGKQVYPAEEVVWSGVERAVRSASARSVASGTAEAFAIPALHSMIHIGIRSKNGLTRCRGPVSCGP